MNDLRHLTTEACNPRSTELDSLPTSDLLTLINDEDLSVPRSVRACIPTIEKVVQAVTQRLRNSGRLFYIGAGTSGRLGCVDASEMPPTYGVEPTLVQGIIAGGPEALLRSKEGAEDDGQAGIRAVGEHRIGEHDAVVGISASGRARYVREALLEAQRRDAFTACITCNQNSDLIPYAHLAIVAETGPEVVTGSTRMKAGTAQKLILNMLSTAVMVRLGRVKGNRMIDLQLKCEKLRERARNLVMDEAQVDAYTAVEALLKSEGKVRDALNLLMRSEA